MGNYTGYDIEVFAHDCLVVCKDFETELKVIDGKKVNTVTVINVRHWWNTFDGLYDFIEDRTLIGFNNYYYDDIILTAMLRDMSPEQIKEHNDIVISGKKTPIIVNKTITSLDCFQQIDVSRPSLKKIEGNMGRMIKESSIPFDLDRPLTEQERLETYEYCCYDVDTTIEVFALREYNYFESKQKLLEMYDNPKATRWNTTTISANLLLEKPLPTWAALKINDEMWGNDIIPPEVWGMWSQVRGIRDLESRMKVKTRTITAFDNKIQFGFGGLHGAHKKNQYFENVKLLDVSSMYPSIAINLKILGEATKKYEGLKRQRMEVKHKDKPLSDALKVVLNSVYGNLKNKYSMLNNPKASMTVCIVGQIALYTLCHRLAERGCTIININTDGVAFKDNNFFYDDVWKDWEKEFNLDLELDNFDLWIQKDVNNYIATQNGQIKTKGGDVNRYLEDKFFSNNNARILDIALVDYLLFGKDIIETLKENVDKPQLYQYVLKAGNTYKGVFDIDGNQYNKVNRVFACVERLADNKLYKKRCDGGLVNFPNVPENMKLWSGDCEDIKDFETWVDLDHYYKIIMGRLKAWPQRGV